MRSVGACTLVLGLLAISSASEPAVAMPVTSLAMHDRNLVEAQFLGGPFFGPHGYYHKNPADRHYFYEGFDPRVYPRVKRWRVYRRHWRVHVYRKRHR